MDSAPHGGVSRPQAAPPEVEDTLRTFPPPDTDRLHGDAERRAVSVARDGSRLVAHEVTKDAVPGALAARLSPS